MEDRAEFRNNIYLTIWCFVMSPRHFYEAFDYRPLTWEFAHRVQHASYLHAAYAYESLRV